MSEGVDMIETVNEAADAPAPEVVDAADAAAAGGSDQPTPEPKPASSTLAPPPPVARLQRAYKAELLPPPPGVVSKRDRPKPAAAPVVEQTASPQPATQSSIEQGQMPATVQEQEEQPALGSELDPTLASADPHAAADPEQVENPVHAEAPQADAPAQLPEEDQPLPPEQATVAPIQNTSRPTPAFQSALASDPEVTKSKSRGMWLAIAGILLLAGLTYWQLGS